MKLSCDFTTTAIEAQEDCFDDLEITFRYGRHGLYQQNPSELRKNASRLALSFGTLPQSSIQAFKDVIDQEGLSLNAGFFSGSDNFELHNAKKLIALAKINGTKTHYPDSIFVYIELSIVYLLPEYRGRGVGSALAKGIGYAIAEEIIFLIFEVEETGKKLDITFSSDFVTDEGEEFFNQMVNFAEEIVRIHAQNIKLNIDIDAGF